MKIDKTQICGKRFMFTVAYFIQSSVLLTAFVLSLTRQDSWLVVIFSIIIFTPVIWLYRTIMVKYPDYNLLQVLEHIFGKFIGKILSVGFIWYFLNLTMLNLRDLGSFTKITVMTDTPLSVLSIMCMIVAVYAIRKGINVVCRYSITFTFVQVVIVIVSILLVADQIKFDNLLPIFSQPQLNYLQGIHVVSTIPLGELVCLLMLTPNIRMKKEDASKLWYWGYAIGVFTFLIVMLRELTVLGNIAHLFALPALTTFRLVHIGTILNRIEIIFALSLILILSFKVVILTYIVAISIAQLFNLKSYQNITLVVAMIIVPATNIVFANAIENQTYGIQVVPFIWMMFEIVIPALIVAITYFKSIMKKANYTPQKQPQQEKAN